MNEALMKSAIEEFNENGIRFTMDDLAARMRVSKRTIYENIGSKEAMISDIIEFVFDDIKAQESEIVADMELDITDKIRRVICLQPRIPCLINYNKIYEIQKHFPDLYKKIDSHLAGEWEVTLSLFKQGMEEGKIRKDVNLNIVRQILLSTMRILMEADSLTLDQTTYEDAMDQALDIVMNGLCC